MRKVLFILLFGSQALAYDFTGTWLFTRIQCYTANVAQFPGSSFSTSSKCYLPDICDSVNLATSPPTCLHYTPQYVPSYQISAPGWQTTFGGYSESIVIGSGAFTSHITMNGCAVNITGSFASSSTNLTFSDQKVSSATLGSCPVDRGRTGTSGILPVKTETTYSTGDTLGTYDNKYILRTSPDIFEIEHDEYSTPFEYKECVTGTPVIKKDICYWVYTKQ